MIESFGGPAGHGVVLAGAPASPSSVGPVGLDPAVALEGREA